MPHIRRRYTDGRLIIPVRVSRPDAAVVDARHFLVDAMLDTGAEMTVIHRRIAEDLSLPIVNSVELRGVTSSEPCYVYAARLAIHTSDLRETISPLTSPIYSFSGKHVVGAPLIEERNCLIGMDILDRLKLEVGGGEFSITFREFSRITSAIRR